MERLICPAVFAVNSSTQKMLKIDLKKEENLISSDNLHLGVGTTRTVNKCITTQTLEVRKFKKNARKFSIHLVEKLKERSPVRYKYAHYRSCLSLNQIVSSKDEFSINLLVNCIYYSVNKVGSLRYVQIVLKFHANYLQ